MISYRRIEQNVPCGDVYVYTLGANPSWRSIGPTEYDIEYGHHALVNGAIHWMAYGANPWVENGTGSFTMTMVLISFDFGDEKFRELSLPEIFGDEDIKYHLKLVELGGFLSLYLHKDKFFFEIWVMKNYGDEQSWTKVFSVARPILSTFWGSFKPLVILKKDEEILCESDYEFFILNVVKNEIRILHPSGEHYNSGKEMYFESLVSLRVDGGTDLANKLERKDGKILALEATGD
ncbi:hypothetical protein NE237_009649 [Protea cynaroides]|uniref:F-box associated beta-propeller type 1 domain-containing protein n=1 Tax=Protea cynaroides TaxID=273540 RepID=A0A9Q0R0U7_9MAGN|nr:hypothetical protein NE237_009649 [Protea cynaroides]